MERMFWTAGLQRFSHILLVMMEENGLYGIKKGDSDVTVTIQWQPMLGKDRQQLVQEVVARKGVNLGSMELLLGLLGDVPDPAAEAEKIMEEIQQMMAMQQAMQPGDGESGGDNSGNSGGKTKAIQPKKPRDFKKITQGSRPGEQTNASGAPDQMKPATTGMGGGGYGLSGSGDGSMGPGQVGL
jgi:hypothetical protein